MTAPTPGLHRGVDATTYASWQAVRQSDLKAFRRSPMHARYSMQHPPKDTAAKELGAATHCAILESDSFVERYALTPKVDRRTKAGKLELQQWEAENATKTGLTQAEWDACLKMRDATWSHPVAKHLLGGRGINEGCLVWEDRTGLLCKARFDRLIGHFISPWDQQEWPAIIDAKTTRDAAPGAFERDLHRFGYHLQAAHYLAGADAVSPANRRFVLICVENEPPHAVAVYEMHEAALEAGERMRQRFLAQWAECEASGSWPGYPETVGSIGLPAWAYAQEERAA